MMRKIVGLALVGIFLCSIVFAFPISIKILTEKEIAALTDKELIDAYVDVLVEIETAKTFHQVSGFQPKEIDSFKELLRYRILIILEMQKREMEIPKALQN